MIALFEFTAGLIFWLCYTLYKDYSKKKYKDRLDDVASYEKRFFATRDEIIEFIEKGDAAIDEVSDDMIKLFGDDWKYKFVWQDFIFLNYYNTRLNMVIGWQAVAILYFAKRGKILSRKYDVLPNKINDNIVFFKYIESLIKEKDCSMRMIFNHDMVSDIYERGKYHVNESGSGDLVWEYYYRNFHNKYYVSEYLW